MGFFGGPGISWWIFFLEGLEFSILELGLPILGLELWVAVGLACKLVDCSRVLNVNRSLYGSTSPGRAQQDVLRAQRAHPVRGPNLYYHRGSCFSYCLYSSFTTVRLQGGLLLLLYFCVCVCVSVQWEI